MNENTLLKISLAISIIGIIGLYFTAEYSSLPEFNSSEIRSHIGQEVMISGVVTNIYSGEKIDKFILKDERYGGIIPVILFKDERYNTTFSIGQKLKVSGEIREYNNNVEIIGYIIRKE